MDAAARNPVVCGALGRHDPAVVERIAAALPHPPAEVHADGRSRLWLDRAPLRWTSGVRRGLGWSERFPAPDPSGVGSWRQAAQDLDACGLVLGARRRALHASVSGASPLYWLERDGAIYFASRIDALVRGVAAPLDVDWECWAAILAVRHPLGDNTPFRQVRRLPQFGLLEQKRGGAQVERPAWPWAAVEPVAEIGAAADATIAAARETLAPLRETGAVVLLSGGLDSRAVLGIADDAGVPLRALTAVADDGLGWEADIAARAAAAAGIPHEKIAPAGGAAHRAAWLGFLEDSDFQFLHGAFVLPVDERLRQLGLPALDGLALDTLGAPGGRFYTREILDPPPGFDVRANLFESMHAFAMPKVAARALSPPLARTAIRSARRQFRRAVRPYAESPSQALLSLYATRTVRAISLAPAQSIGRHAKVVAPFAADRVARASLTGDPRQKFGRAFHQALYARIDSPSVREPTDRDVPRPPGPAVDRRNRFSPEMVSLYTEALRDGPLTPHLGQKLARHVREDTVADAIRNHPLHRAAMVVTSFHRWAERYGGLLREPDPTELLDLG